MTGGPIVLFGIPNCDTVKKARAWLTGQGVEVRFHDFAKSGVPVDRLAVWLAALGWEAVLNRRGTTWRKLPEADRDAVVDASSAARLIVVWPSLVKRPVVEWPDGRVTVGFDAAAWAAR